MSYQTQIAGKQAFSTTDNLTASEVYTSGVLDLQGYTQVETHIQTDAEGTLTFEFLTGPNYPADVVRTLSVPYTPPDFKAFGAPAFTPYVRYSFTATTSSSEFFYDTKFTTTSINGQILGMEDFISPLMVANLGRNLIVGRKPGDNDLYGNVAVDSENRLDISLPRSAFGEIEMVEPTPVIQASFPYSTINSRIWTQGLSGTADITAASSVVSVSAGGANSHADLKTIRSAKYRPGQGINARFTSIFTAPAVGSSQEIGIGDDVDGFFFCTSGAEYGINRRQNGTDNITLQSAWNLDKADGTQVLPTIDFTKANVHQIQYQWLGYGAITYGIEDPRSGRFTPVHREQYANTNTVPSVFNPTLPLTIKATNTTKSTPTVLKSSSLAAFVEGKVEITGPTFNTQETTAANGTTPVFGIAVENKSTYSGDTNRVPIQMKSLYVVNDNSRAAIVSVYKDVDTSGFTTFGDVNTLDSVVQATTGTETTTYPASALAFSTAAGANNSIELDITDSVLFPGENFAVIFNLPAAGSGDVIIGFNWQEDF